MTLNYKQIFNELLKHTNDLVIIKDIDNNIVFTSDKKNIFNSLLKNNYTGIYNYQDNIFDISCSELKVNQISYMFYIIKDVTKIKEKESLLEQKASIDPLTRVLNRYGFKKSLKPFLKTDTNLVYLFICDIDDFKKVNDTYGHSCGDYILKETANIINETLNKNALLARAGGEEFIGLIKVNSKNESKLILKEIKDNIEKKVYTYDDNIKVNITISFGAHILSDLKEINSVIKKADTALYYSKNTGKNKISYFDSLKNITITNNSNFSKRDFNLHNTKSKVA